MNPFEIESEAERYHLFRPQYHHLPLEQVRALAGHEIDAALDVACGTGHSTMALSRISRTVTGCDASEAMLAQARKNYSFPFIQCPAEALPFNDTAFDLVNISMGFHWLKQEKFLAEVNRVLKPDGWLVIDNYGFTGQLSTDPEKQRQHDQLFTNHLPATSRQPGYPTDEMISQAKLRLIQSIEYSHKIAMTADAFANLILTWSNFQVLPALEKPFIQERIKATYDLIFEGKTLELEFGGKAMLLRKAS